LTTVDDFVGGRSWAAESRLRLARRRVKKPDTKAGQIRALWPEIAAALEGGQSFKSIRQWLEEDAGIIVSTTSLTSYVSRIRRQESRSSYAHESPADQIPAVEHPVIPVERAVRMRADAIHHPEPHLTADPIAQAMRALTRPQLDIRKLHGDGDPTGKNLI
jgi:hypothetical protein